MRIPVSHGSEACSLLEEQEENVIIHFSHHFSLCLGLHDRVYSLPDINSK